MATGIPLEAHNYGIAFDNWLKNRDKPMARGLVETCFNELNLPKDKRENRPHRTFSPQPVVTLIQLLKEDYDLT